MKSINEFAAHAIQGTKHIVGGTGTCPAPTKKGNNGIGQEKRGVLDGPPPGLAAQERQDFNDKSGNKHGVEV